ncbi:MAG: AhpC/TSA family protein [Candidatus Binatus sp.]|nr:AhpC/TSA family protein [Candidatus Binatus sp.]
MASISYDSAATLKRFADAYNIGYPMLSDQGSAVITSYGILNRNIPEGHPFHGIPFPGDFLLNRDGTVRDKRFLPDYQARPAASEVLLRNFGANAGGPAASIVADDVIATVTLSADRTVPGQQIGFIVEIEIGAGWHIYGQPLPENYVATAISFETDVIAEQTMDFPKATPVEFKSLGETLPVYSGKIRAAGTILMKPGIKPGNYELKGTLTFQECNDEICKLPQKVKFALPMKVEAMTGAAK